jgi:hypothetical protein
MNSSDFTFIIPLKIESADRRRNTTVCIKYLKKYLPDCTIIVKESDDTQKFPEELLEHVTYIFEKNDSEIFHRTRLLNEMLCIASTPIVANYDVDILLPFSTFEKIHEMIVDQDYDLVYPYEYGNFQYRVFLENQPDFSDVLEIDKIMTKSVFSSGNGHAQFFNTTSYRNGYMENENFISYGPEDEERFHRFNLLGYKIGRINDYVYHIEHSRTLNSSNSNPYFSNNWELYNYLRSIGSEQFTHYYTNQTYLKKYDTSK